MRAIAIWFLLVALAILNGTVRTVWLLPRFGDRTAHLISTLSLCLLVLAAAWAFVGWMRPAFAQKALGIGFLWLALTVAFEFGAGHYLFKNSWEKLFADYNIFQGRIWIAVLVLTFFAPYWAARLRGLIR